MHQISLADAEKSLPQLIQGVLKGEDFIILQNEKPVARLTSVTEGDLYPLKKIKPGSAKGLIKIPDNFDEPLEDFKEYME